MHTPMHGQMGGGHYGQGGNYSQGGGGYSQGGSSYSQGGSSYSQGGNSYSQGGGGYMGMTGPMPPSPTASLGMDMGFGWRGELGRTLRLGSVTWPCFRAGSWMACR